MHLRSIININTYCFGQEIRLRLLASSCWKQFLGEERNVVETHASILDPNGFPGILCFWNVAVVVRHK